MKRIIGELQKPSNDRKESNPSKPTTKSKQYISSLLATVSDQMEHLQSKLDSTQGIESKPEHVQRELCAKRDNFYEDFYKVKIEFNKSKAELFKEVSDPDLLETIDKATAKMEEKIGELESECKFAVDTLKCLDESKLLYAMSKAVLTTPYPSPKFSGAPGQNLIIWLEKMRVALDDNQISKQKRVTILRANLEGQAKKLVAENIKEWEDAKKILTDAFGNAKILWMNLYGQAKEKLSLWGAKYSDKDLKGVEFAMEGIRGMQEFLREAELMCETTQLSKQSLKMSSIQSAISARLISHES